MTTLTIKINERTKAGKAFMAMAEPFFKDAMGVEIIKSSNAASKPEVAQQKSLYDPKFVAMIKRREKNMKNQKLTRLDPNDIWGSIL